MSPWRCIESLSQAFVRCLENCTKCLDSSKSHRNAFELDDPELIACRQKVNWTWRIQLKRYTIKWSEC